MMPGHMEGHSTGYHCHGVPQPKPTFAPEGYRRCKRCNSLVKGNKLCRKCEAKRRADGLKSVKNVRYVIPKDEIAAPAEYPEVIASSYDNGEMRDWSGKKKRSATPKLVGGRCAKQPTSERATCKCCGASFERKTNCRPATMCEECRKLSPSKRGSRRKR